MNILEGKLWLEFKFVYLSIHKYFIFSIVGMILTRNEMQCQQVMLNAT